MRHEIGIYAWFPPMTSWSILHFQADDLGAFSCIIPERLLCLLIVSETMFTIGESRTISHPNETELQAQQVPPNPRRGRFSIETPLENAD